MYGHRRESAAATTRTPARSSSAAVTAREGAFPELYLTQGTSLTRRDAGLCAASLHDFADVVDLVALKSLHRKTLASSNCAPTTLLNGACSNTAHHSQSPVLTPISATCVQVIHSATFTCIFSPGSVPGLNLAQLSRGSSKPVAAIAEGRIRVSISFRRGSRATRRNAACVLDAGVRVQGWAREQQWARRGQQPFRGGQQRSRRWQQRPRGSKGARASREA